MILLRVELIFNLIILWKNYFLLFVSDFNSAWQILDFRLFDAMVSIKMFIILPILFYIFRKKLSILKERLSISLLIISLLLLAFVFAPIITDDNPEFQKNLKVTKLLSPFSGVKIIHLAGKEETPKSAVGKFINYRNSIIHPSYDESIILADEVYVKSSHLVYSQKEISKQISIFNLEQENGIPIITERMYLLGTDEFGRDIFTRIVYGSRVSLLVGLGSVLVSLLIGLSFGFFAGFKGGLIDVILSRITDLFLAFPVIYLVVLILALFGNSLVAVILVLGVSGWMSMFKIVKSEVLSEGNKDYIVTANMIGQSKRRILTKEILPVILIPLVVNLVFQFSNVILAESALSYLGLGTGSFYPSWGSMIESGQRYITKAWWLISFPGLILIFTIFAANDLGKKLNKVINPRLDK